ncbi:hypothetical protein BDZ90DRAFT_278097 [Jaminaea rosea]|uniref:Polynucleotide 5'-hydroxyl-kinase GRC3 n=1 Tax=Jaminaea rosea TaxID=1569628 RepID=A0A316UX31_9BASI|nr:hypothetical protein BDZ90DRAFT_278097 [Jaminaea rosea]PWN29849.1 hypothetical protein BDZ90DRAFT_278097 [Jaminaea rosea]
MSAIAARKARLAAAKAQVQAQQETLKPLSTTPPPPPPPQAQPPRKRQRSVEVASSESDGSEAESSASGSRTRTTSPSSTPIQADAIQWLQPVWAQSTSSKEPHNVSILSTKGKGKARAEEALVLRIQPGKSIAIRGTAQLLVTEGIVSVNGCHVSPTSPKQLLLCPSTDPLPLLTACGEEEATIELHAISSTGLETLANVCPLAGTDPFSLRPRRDIQSLLVTSQHLALDPSLTVQRQPPSWQEQWDRLQAAEPSATPQAVLVRGAKGAGKSTFGRTLLNIYAARHQRVALLDVDLGQGHFQPAGSVHLYIFSLSSSSNSQHPLISPSWLTHPCLPAPAHSIFLGQTTPKDLPSSYFRAVAHLIERYDATLRGEGVPLLVNTMGWAKGMGAELNERIEGLLRPEAVYDLMPTLDPYATGGKVARIELPKPYRAPHGGWVTPVQAVGLDMKAASSSGDSRMSSTQAGLTAADQRSLAMMTHLHASSASPLPRWDFSHNLIERRPFVVDVRTGLQGGIHLGMSDQGRVLDVGVGLAALNGEMVSLCIIDVADQDVITASIDSQPQDGDIAATWRHAFSRPPPPPGSERLICLALVRSIDEQAGKVHLLCPPCLAELVSRAHSQSQSPPRLALIATGGSAAIAPPIFAFLDRPSFAARGSTSGEAEQNGATKGGRGAGMGTVSLLAGVPRNEAPYLSWPADATSAGAGGKAGGAIVGAGKRRVRRNVMRRGQRG